MKAVPGPGTYNMEPGKYGDSNKRKEPEYRIGTASRNNDSLLRNAKRSPGPGNYNTIESANVVHHHSPNYRIGSAKRMQDFAGRSASNERVGPGTYEPK